MRNKILEGPTDLPTATKKRNLFTEDEMPIEKALTKMYRQGYLIQCVNWDEDMYWYYDHEDECIFDEDDEVVEMQTLLEGMPLNLKWRLYKGSIEKETDPAPFGKALYRTLEGKYYIPTRVFASATEAIDFNKDEFVQYPVEFDEKGFVWI